MKRLWQRFVALAGDPEVAVVSLLFPAFTIVASVGGVMYCLNAGHYLGAAGIGVGVVVVVGMCIRDYRRCRWGVVSSVVVGFWLVLTLAALVYGIWLNVSHG